MLPVHHQWDIVILGFKRHSRGNNLIIMMTMMMTMIIILVGISHRMLK